MGNLRTPEYLEQEQIWVQDFKNNPNSGKGIRAARNILKAHQLEINRGLKKKISDPRERKELKADCEAYILQKIYQNYEPSPPLFLYINKAILFFCYGVYNNRRRVSKEISCPTPEIFLIEANKEESLTDYSKVYTKIFEILQKTKCIPVDTPNYLLAEALCETSDPTDLSKLLNWTVHDVTKQLGSLRRSLVRRQNKKPDLFDDIYISEDLF